MRIDDMILVSVDDHTIEPADMFDRHIGAKYRDRAPRMVKSAAGDDLWSFEGRMLPNVGLNAVSGRPPEEYGFEPTRLEQMRTGCYDIHARIGDMDANGVLASMCFPSFPSFAGKLFAQTADKELALAVLRAYNDWHIHDWAGAYPGRFIPLALLPLWDAKLSADEVRRVSELGCHAVSFSANPVDFGLPSIHQPFWKPLWEACSDRGAVLCMHIGTGGPMPFASPEMPIDASIAATPVSIVNTAADWVFSQVLRDYPDLRLALSEGGIGWIPYFLERCDYTYAHHHAWTHQDFGPKRPSDVFREHVLTCFIDDAIGIQLRHEVGIQNITWECDYPHSDSTWPTSPEILARSLRGVADAEVDLITHGNAMRWFQLDSFERLGGRERCTVAALRAQAKHVDLSLLRGKGGKPPSTEKRPVTMADTMAQLASALDGQATRAGA
jgi:predicted TIM-barrel fold metal-dependent hydrolase